MKLFDFVEQKKLEELQDSFSEATGIAISIKDSDGNHITKSKYDTGFGHSSLTDFSESIIVNGEKLGLITASQIISSEKQDMGEADINKIISLVGILLNSYVNMQFLQNSNAEKLSIMNEEIKGATATVQTIGKKANELESIASKQNMLALNASIEAARSGEAGVGFAVVAKQMGELSKKSEVIYSDIKKSAIEITKSIGVLADALDTNNTKKH